MSVKTGEDQGDELKLEIVFLKTEIITLDNLLQAVTMKKLTLHTVY
jgi:hypothetical protein